MTETRFRIHTRNFTYLFPKTLANLNFFSSSGALIRFVETAQCFYNDDNKDLLDFPILIVLTVIAGWRKSTKITFP